MVGCGQTSATWLPSTMRLPPSTRPSGPRERRSSAFIREDSGIAERPRGFNARAEGEFRCRTRLRRPYRTLDVEGLEIFHREAGPRDAPTVLFSSSLWRQ